MKWFKNIRTSKKLGIAFGLIVLLLVAIIAVAAYGITKVNEHYKVAVALAEFEANNNGQRSGVLALLNLTDAQERATALEEVGEYSSKNDRLLEALTVLLHGSSDSLAQLQRLKDIRLEYKRVRDEQVIPLLSAGEIEQARSISAGNRARYLAMRDLAAELSDDAQTRARQVVSATLFVNVAVGILAVVCAAVLAFLLTKILATPLHIMSATAERMAQGDLSYVPPTEATNDELGILVRNFSHMSQSLQEMAVVAERISAGDLKVNVQPQSERDVLGHAFAKMVANLRKLTEEIALSVSVLGTSTTQISTSTTQFAASATETATAVSETTTTVEEVRQTAQVSRDKAKSVSDAAQRAAEVSKSGLKATQDTFDGMNRIRLEMDAIAESMVRMSNQSQAIGQIVTTVEDLATQSNLLAVNASIEAAKAGEYGKGFAVVAQEVKSLAEQSKLATGQARVILDDIQKATAAAVMVTEQGTRAVEAGLQQASKAGDSIQAMSISASEAAQAALQISASSQQQLVGVDQVASAMESIKVASSQNAESARQLERAAQGLQELGQKLKQLVEMYSL